MNPIEGVEINMWILGIGGAIFTFTIVFLFTKLLFTNKMQIKLKKSIELANSELASIIIPLVVEKRIPRGKIIESFRISIAQKHKVNPSDLLCNSDLANSIINEVFTNPYLRSDQKIDLSDSAERLISEISDHEINQKTSIKNDQIQTSNILLFIISFISALMVLATTVFVSCKDPSFSSDFRNYIILIAISTLTPILLLLLAQIPWNKIVFVSKRKVVVNNSIDEGKK